jgi:DedD protein
MALFNFRKNADLNNGSQASAEPVESVEVLRKKTLHRLIGSAVLVIVGVIVFSLVFDRQPRPIPVDIAIQIPSKEGVSPLVIAPPVASAPSAPPVLTASAPEATPSAPTAAPMASEPVSAKASLAAKEEIVPAAAKESTKPVPAGAAKEVAKPAPVKEPVKEPAKDSSKTESERAKALLEGKTPAAPEKAASAQAGRFVVQVGAFADATKARQARLKVEKSGLKTYTHVAETAEGKRIRVRVGPFGNRDEAEKAAKKIKSLDLPAAILTL